MADIIFVNFGIHILRCIIYRINVLFGGSTVSFDSITVLFDL